MTYYSLTDFIILLGSSTFSYILVVKSKLNFHPNPSLIFIAFVGIFLSIATFIPSDEIPNIYLYKNRMLGALRLFFTIFMIVIFLLFLKKNIIFSKIALFLSLILLCITTIGIKNAWIFTHRFHHTLFDELNKHLPKSPKTHYILLTFDKSKDNPKDDIEEILNTPHLILKEPIHTPYMDLALTGKKTNFNNKYQIFYFYDINFIRKIESLRKNRPQKYYLYDYKTKTMEYVEENP